MKHLYKVALLSALGMAAVTTAHATAGDVFLGFNDDSGSISSATDYVIDLGYSASQLVTLATANSGTYGLSGTFSSTSFTTAFGTASGETDPLDNVAVGAVEGNFNVYSARVLAMTVVDSTDNGAPPQLNYGNFNPAINSAGAVTAGEKAASVGTSFSYNVAQDPSTGGLNVAGNDVATASGNNPMAYLSGGSITGQGNLELFAATQNTSGGNGSMFSDLGWFDVTIGGTSGAYTDTITFNVPVVEGGAAPEPAMYGILAGAGLLLLALRRQFVARTA